MKKILITLFLILCAVTSAQNFFPTKQGDIYQIEEVTFYWIDPYYNKEYSQFVSDEVTVNNKTFVRAWDHYYRMDTTVNKLYILLNNEEKLAFDFDKPDGSTDTLYFNGFARLSTYSSYQNWFIFGETRMARSIKYNSYDGPIEWFLVDGIGIYKRKFINQLGYFDVNTTVISTIIDDSVYNPITLDVTAYFPNKIARTQSSFSFLVDINTEYIGLVDSLNANVIAYNSDSLIYQNTFIGSIDLGKIIINIPLQILSQTDSVGIRVHCTDESIFNNNVFVPELGHKFIYVEDESEWSFFTPTISGTNFMGMKFFSANKGYIYKYSGDISNMIFYNNLTTDGGQSFNSSYGSSGFWSINSIISFNQNTGYMIRERLLKTTDQGETWAYNLNYSLYAMSFIDEDTGWVSHDYEKKISRTYNGGLNWQTLNTNLQECFYLLDFAQWNEGYAVTISGKVYHSTDGGETWLFTNSTLTNQKKLNMFQDGKGWLIGEGIWRTEDGGFNWTQQLAGNFVDAHFFNKDKGWVIGKVNETNVLLRTIDGGNNWSEVGAPYTQGDFKNIDFVDELHGWIYAYSWNSNELLRTTNGGVTFVEDEILNNEQPSDFTLSQNYPNPFNPSTIISYQLPIAGNVTLKVYDVLGREVTTLVDVYRNAGSYNVEFRIENLPAGQAGLELSSGIYFYQFKAGEFVETKKMMLIK